MIRLPLLAASLCLVSCASHPTVYITDDSLADLDSAAYRALSPLRDPHAQHEQAGALLQSPDGRYSFTMPVTQERDSFELRVRVLVGWKVAGIYHTHPGDDKASLVFSGDDLDMAKHLGIPSYILFQATGEIRKYVPGQTQTQLTPVRNGMSRTADGELLAP